MDGIRMQPLKNEPLVTVVIPTHNRAHLLPRAVKSVLEQTYRSFELIIVDDASTDSTRQIVEGISDGRIHYACHEENRGGPAARNTGISRAKGAYVALLDDDDEWMPRKLEEQVQMFSRVTKRVGLIYSGLEVRSSQGRVIDTIMPELRGNLRIRLLEGTTIGSPTPLIRTECFTKVGLFDETLKSCQDWDMWKRISEQYEFDFVPDILAATYFHEHQISSDLSCRIPGRQRMIEKHMEEFRLHPDILVTHLKQLGKLHCINGTWKEAIHWFGEAAKVSIFEIVKIAAWLVIEYPKVKLVSREKDFARYDPGQDKRQS